MKLTFMMVKNAKPKTKPYKLSDGGGLHLYVKPNGSRLWRFLYRFDDKEKTRLIGMTTANISGASVTPMKS